ncbi:MAG: DNA translocase FtsK 4TM domain-containing protein [Pyrinomonadaceae bacterium]|nr:DNA translocase FtsK 4TM domain-containing protein [Pyrinomonadaceae bacterium]
MKYCPKCKVEYEDNEINFCLSDGTALLKSRSNGTTLIRKEKNQTEIKPNSHYKEVTALGLAAIALLLFLSLVTYNPYDWSLNTRTSEKTQNLIGVFGAVISDLMFQAIGLSAYIFPALILLIAWRIFRSESLIPRFSRIFGIFLFIISVSALTNLFDFSGGIVGAIFARFFSYLLSPIGAGILLFTFLTASILLLTNFSFFGFFENFDIASQNFRIHFNEWREKRRLRHEAQLALNPEKAEKRTEKRVEKNGKDSPTISLGDKVAVSEKESAKNGKGKVSILDSLKPVENEEVKLEMPLENEVVEEIPAPTISASDSEEKYVEDSDFSRESDFDSLNDLVAENNKIPITPIQETGELSEDFIEEIEEAVELEPEKPKKPQNFEDYILPASEFLTPAMARIEQKEDDLLATAQELTEKTKEFNVTGRVVHICQGPVVTTYEFKPDPGVKYSRVTGLVDDLCLALKAESIRIDRIPGKAFVGIEVPNQQRETIQLREVIESKKFKESNSLLSIALGKTIDGLNYVADLSKMPHLLMAGQTGAGKSVGVNSLIVSILYKAKPDEVKFIMVDPKQVELGIYADIPHLATPIIKDPKRASVALKWTVSEMEKRYKDLAGWGVRNIDGYNAEVKRKNSLGQLNDNGEPFRVLPYIVVIIDELADLMMVSGKEVEESITRLAQMARAVGIHLVLATQRPSVDVITGLIKANFPSRISFRVSSKVDSRTIIDSNGAESLLGKGDMLFLPPGTSNLVRVHGAFVDEKEIARIVDYIKAQGNPEYDTTITKTEDEMDDSGELPGRKDPLFWDAVKSVVSAKRASTSLLQRHLRIGYGRAAAILDAMVREGYIGEMDGGTRARPILQKAYDDLQDMYEMEN